jgi:hypothetical protein
MSVSKLTPKEGRRLVSAEQKTTGETHPINRNEQKTKALVILRGITTSQINQALKAKSPYPARVFLKIDRSEKKLVGNYDPTKRQCYICLAELSSQEKVWCSPCKEKRLTEDKDIPVFFRISKLGN